MSLTIGKRLGICTGSLAAVIGLCLGISFYNSAILGNYIDSLAGRDSRALQLYGTIKGDLAGLRNAQRGVVIYTSANDPARIAQNRQTFKSVQAELEAALRELNNLVPTEKGKAQLGSISENLNRYVALYQQLDAFCEAHDIAGALKAAQQASPFGNAMQATAEMMIADHNIEIREKQRKSATARSWASGLCLFMLCIGVFATISSVLIVRSLVRELRGAAAQLAEGAQQVSVASGQIANASQSLAQGASEQAASLEDTSAASEEVASLTRKNAESSSRSAELMNVTDQRIIGANGSLAEMVLSMQQITGSADQISHIIKVIDEIAFQTNILALNAAVEAARAGEAGMGFAVVADAVRDLAQRSAKAAKETSELIEVSITKSKFGGVKLGDVDRALKMITESASEVKVLVDDVHLGGQEQARSVAQIAKAILQMQQVTQQTAASAEEGAAASEELNAQAEQMSNVAQGLRRLVDGQASEMRNPHLRQLSLVRGASFAER